MTVTDFSITFASLLFPPPLLFPTQASMPSPQPRHPRGSGSGRFGFQALWGKSGTSSVGGEGVPCRSSRMAGRQSPRPSLGAPAAHRPLPPPSFLVFSSPGFPVAIFLRLAFIYENHGKSPNFPFCFPLMNTRWKQIKGRKTQG